MASSNDELALHQGFVLERALCGWTPTPMCTLEAFQSQMASKNTIRDFKTIVLPGEVDRSIGDMLLSDAGVDEEFLDAHQHLDPYRPRGRRSQDAPVACIWKFPQRFQYGSSCDENVYAAISAHEGIEVLNASLWLHGRMAMLFIERPQNILEKLNDLPLEDELRELIPQADPAVSIEDFVSQLIYERWVDAVAQFHVSYVTGSFLWYVAEAVEQNLDQAKYLAFRKRSVEIATEEAWEGILRRLDRRVRIKAINN